MTSKLALADLAAEQWGMVTTAQARSLGVSPQIVARLATQGALERITHGVYRMTGTPPSPLDDLRAAWLALDPAYKVGERLRDKDLAVVSHRSAAAIYELGDLEADEHEFTSPTRKQTRRPDVRIHRGQVDGEWTTVNGIPVTTIVRTIADLASSHLDGGHLANIVRDAITYQHTDDQQIIQALRPYAHKYNAPLGDGEALLSRFLQESGIPDTMERAVELADDSAAAKIRRMNTFDQGEQMRKLTEQVASIQRMVEPFAKLQEQLSNSSTMRAMTALTEAAARIEKTVQVPQLDAVKKLAETVTRLQAATVPPRLDPLIEAATRMQAVTAAQQFSKQFAEMMEANLAQALSDTLALPESTLQTSTEEPDEPESDE